MLFYDKMYLKLGVRRIAHFIKPVIVDTNTFTFPFKSMLYWFNVSDVVVPLTKKYPYLKNTDKVFVKTVLEYNTDTAVGSYKSAHKLPNTIVTGLMLGEKEFKFIKPAVKDVPMTDKALFILNYGALNAMYTYNPNPLMRYFKWNNVYDKVVSQLQQKNYETTRNRFVTYGIPQQLLTRQELDKFAKKIISTNLERLPTNDYFNLVDLWRYLTPELKHESLLSRIPDNELNNVTLMLMCNDKMVILNLNILAGIVEEYNVQTKLKKYKAATVRKMLYVMLYSLVTNKAIEYDTIVKMPDTEGADISIKQEAFTAQTSHTATVDDTVDLDDILHKHVNEKEEELPIVNVEDGEEEQTEITEEEVKSVTDVNVKTYENKEAILTEEVDKIATLKTNINTLNEFKVITKSEQERMLHVLEAQHSLPSPIPNDTRKLGEILNPTLDKYEIEPVDMEITKNNVIDDESLNRDVIKALNQKYLTEQYDKDLIRSIYALQSHNAVIEDYSISETSSILGTTQTHTVKVKTLKGRPSTLSFILPKVENDGTFKLSGNQYRLRYQRAD